jgi:hypothetical protein
MDPVALLKMTQAQGIRPATDATRRAEGKASQASSGFEAAMLEALKTSRIPEIGEGDESPVDANSWRRLDVPAMPRASQTPKPEESKLTKTAREFEGMLMTQMFQTLRKTVEPSGLFGDNQNERSTYEYILDQSIFQKAAENGQTWGLASRLEEAWKEHFKGGGAQNAKPQ